MSVLPWFPFYFKDFLLSKKVMRMSNEQKGAYLTLLIENWSEPTCSLPRRTSNLRTLANWKGSDKDFALVRACFTPHPDHPGKLYNARLYEEWKKAESKQEAAKASALSRWQRPDQRTEPPPPNKPLAERKQIASKTLADLVSKIADKHFPPID